jgi:hypothetical protein
MADYCTIQQVVGTANLQGYLPKQTGTDAQATIAEIITRCSRRIDAFVTDGRETNYFADAPNTATVKTVFGEGLSFLRLPTHVVGSVASITAPVGFETPNFRELSNGTLQMLDSTGREARYIVFENGIGYGVTAKWGTRFETTPEDIKEACLMLVVRTFRSKDEAFSGVIGGINQDNQIIERAMPEAVKQILSVYRRQYKTANLVY